ncbi:MAG: YbaK/EbsC family protein [Coriobacteriales bacterium]|nr:YbaK/EbsC family protein [Coriobacteriales bacterium]
MSVQSVKEYLRQYGVEDNVVEFERSSATVEMAAQDLGCEPALIAKTMACDVDGHAVLVVCAGDAKLWSSAFKKQFGTKPRFVPADQLTQEVGHPMGGVCPFDVRPGVRTYLDVSLRRFDRVFPAAGSANSAVGLTLPQLERCSQARGWVDVCKGWRQESAA